MKILKTIKKKFNSRGMSKKERERFLQIITIKE